MLDQISFSIGDVISILTVIVFFIAFRQENKQGQSKIQSVLDNIVKRDETVDERARDWQKHMDKSTSVLESIAGRVQLLETITQTLHSIDKSQQTITHTQEKLLDRLNGNDAQHAKVITMLEQTHMQMK